METIGIDPFFTAKQGLLGFGGGFVDVRFFLLSDDKFWNRYHFEMSTYGFEKNRPYWRGGGNIPVCSDCSEKIMDSSGLRRRFGVNFCPVCFQSEMKREWEDIDKRKPLSPCLVYFLRIANILDVVPKKKLEIFIRQCRKEVSKCL